MVDKPLSLDDAANYYDIGENPINEVVRDFVRESGSIVHGGRATNAYLPDYLDVHTEDWDVFVSGDLKAKAAELEGALDERYGHNYFEVRPAKHSGTMRIFSRVTGKAIADLTIPDRHVDFKLIDGTKVATLDYHVEQIRRTLADDSSAYRHGKDRATLQRIMIAKQRGETLDL